MRQLFIQNFPTLRLNNTENPAFKKEQKSKWFLDLYEIARRQLRYLGVQHIYGGNFCTYSDPERFFSYRRDGKTGRMGTLIWMESD